MNLTNRQIKLLLRDMSNLEEKLDFLTEACIESESDETVRFTEALRHHLCKDHRGVQTKDLAPVCWESEGVELQDQEPIDELLNQEDGEG